MVNNNYTESGILKNLQIIAALDRRGIQHLQH